MWTTLTLALLACCMVLPWIGLGIPSGHDFEFHVASWIECARQWHEGVLYPRWAEFANFGAGEPRFVFYPPLSWMWGGIIASVLPIAVVPAVFVWSVLTFAGAAMYTLARRAFDASPVAAIGAAAFFMLNPYSFVAVYWRSAYAELVAMALLPLLVLATLRLFQRPNVARLPSVALAFAALWLSNAPAAILISYFIATLIIVLAVRARNWRAMALSFVALATGLACDVFYLLPAIAQQRVIDVNGVLDPPQRLIDNTLFVASGPADHLAFNRWISAVALSLLIALLIACVRSRRAVVLVSAWFSAVLLLPWAAPLLIHVPKLQFVQFPWRASFVLAFALSLALHDLRRWASVGLVVLVFAAPWAIVRFDPVEADFTGYADLTQMADSMASGTGYEGFGEYEPREPAESEMKPGHPPVVVTRGSVVVERSRTYDRVYRMRSAGGSTVILRLLDFPEWRVEVDGAAIRPGRNASAEIMFHLPAGIHEVHVRWSERHRVVAGASSVLALLALLFAVAIERGKPLRPTEQHAINRASTE